MQAAKCGSSDPTEPVPHQILGHVRLPAQANITGTLVRCRPRSVLTVRMGSVFWLFVIAFNLVGAGDILIDYYHGNQVDLPALAGELGATYAIPIIYVPVLMITHLTAFYLLVRRPGLQAAR